VTLEPCAHYGRTPPCADAIVAAGISEVHVAMLDPSPWVNGHGIAALERAGIRVRLGSPENAARRLNEAYLCWLERGRPLVTGLYALSLDGRPAALDGASLSEAAQSELARLRKTADRTVSSVSSVDGLLSEDSGLTALAANGVTSLHVEAPPATLEALVRFGLLDRVIVFLTPTFGGDEGCPGTDVSAGRQSAGMGALQSVGYERLGDTLVVTGTLPNSLLPTDES
jgi:riboflavin biosynthesis pyrimidine reductase